MCKIALDAGAVHITYYSSVYRIAALGWLVLLSFGTRMLSVIIPCLSLWCCSWIAVASKLAS